MWPHQRSQSQARNVTRRVPTVCRALVDSWIKGRTSTCRGSKTSLSSSTLAADALFGCIFSVHSTVDITNRRTLRDKPPAACSHDLEWGDGLVALLLGRHRRRWVSWTMLSCSDTLRLLASSFLHLFFCPARATSPSTTSLSFPGVVPFNRMRFVWSVIFGFD